MYTYVYIYLSSRASSTVLEYHLHVNLIPLTREPFGEFAVFHERGDAATLRR